jgi:hypothetical protein
MNKKSKLPSKWLEPHDPIPEIDLGSLSQILKDYFNILSDPPSEKYKVRFIGSPYNPFVAECSSITATAHHRGGSRGLQVAPIMVKQVLRKFGITENEFRTAYNSFFSKQTGEATPLHDSSYIN